MQVVLNGRAFELSETLQSEELAPIFADAWTASRVWDASTYLSEHLIAFATTLQTHSFCTQSSTGDVKTVIELGSGCGLAGLVAASLGGDVLLTDQHEAVELLQRNVAANAISPEEAARLHVAEYTWGTEPSQALPRPKFDYILVSDCINPIYGAESWRNLARSIHALSDDHTVTYLTHEKRGDDEAMVDFLEFSASFLVSEKIAQRDRLTHGSFDSVASGSIKFRWQQSESTPDDCVYAAIDEKHSLPSTSSTTLVVSAGIREG
ncbi:putative n2,n2-dimethylguanosine trna methyltransferase, partial [Globisporangium splendens]